jgi:hypothetical protein
LPSSSASTSERGLTEARQDIPCPRPELVHRVPRTATVCTLY